MRRSSVQSVSAINIINEKESDLEKHISQLRDALESAGIGEDIELDDKFLVKFLRAKLYKIEETRDMIKNYISIFKKYPEFFEGVDFCRKPFEDGLFYVIPDRTPTGETVAVLRGGLWDPSVNKFPQALVTTVYGYELAELDESTQINGVIEILDVGEVGLRHFLKVGITEIRMAIEMSEVALPIRWRKIFVVFQNKFVDIIYSIAKPLMSKEFRETISFIGKDMTKLHELVPKEMLPAKYGGTSDKCDPVDYFKYLQSKEDRLLKMWEPFKSKK